VRRDVIQCSRSGGLRIVAGVVVNRGAMLIVHRTLAGCRAFLDGGVVRPAAVRGKPHWRELGRDIPFEPDPVHTGVGKLRGSAGYGVREPLLHRMPLAAMNRGRIP
jgi:hypothetical protein